MQFHGQNVSVGQVTKRIILKGLHIYKCSALNVSALLLSFDPNRSFCYSIIFGFSSKSWILWMLFFVTRTSGCWFLHLKHYLCFSNGIWCIISRLPRR